MPEVIARGKRLRYDTTNAIGKGGEADVYDVGGGEVLKVYKTADHPDLALDPVGKTAAIRRIAEHQRKLPELVKLPLPSSVVAPSAVATDCRGSVVGYVMPFLASTEVLLSYSQRDFRQDVDTNDVVAVLRDLYAAVVDVHRASVVIGDFNDLNVLVAGTKARFIDSDSFQFGAFRCKTYTTTFVDPRLCDPDGSAPVLVEPHTTESDWYAFTVMVMQLLCFVGPYGGVYKPTGARERVVHPRRPLKRVTVFDADVRLPKCAASFTLLPDDLLQHLHLVFERDERGVFPAHLLERLRWTRCVNCGAEHGRANCPTCCKVAPAAVRKTTMVRGQVTATRVFSTRGRVLRAEVRGGRALWLWHEGGQLRREGGAVVGVLARPDPHARFRLRADETFVAASFAVLRVLHGGSGVRVDVDPGPVPMFDANESHTFWVRGGVLYRDNGAGSVRVGDVLRGQTMFWVGPAFGFGVYRAGSLSAAFVFTASAGSLNDSVKLPPIVGKLVDAACTFSKERVWFFTTTQEGARTVNRCTVVRADGLVEASAEADHGDGSWLGAVHGAAAGEHVKTGSPGGSFLLVPTDDGVVQVKVDGDRVVESKKFPDTEPFVGADSKLLIGADGLYVVGAHDITRLVIT